LLMCATIASAARAAARAPRGSPGGIRVHV
jgi:hypothetical protein